MRSGSVRTRPPDLRAVIPHPCGLRVRSASRPPPPAPNWPSQPGEKVLDQVLSGGSCDCRRVDLGAGRGDLTNGERVRLAARVSERLPSTPEAAVQGPRSASTAVGSATEPPSDAVIAEPQLNETKPRSTDHRRTLHSSAELGSDLLRSSIERRQETYSSTDHVEAIDAWRAAPDTPALKRRSMPGEQPTQAVLTRHDGSSVISRAHQGSTVRRRRRRGGQRRTADS